MRIDSSGRLGIGTTSPGVKLSVTTATAPSDLGGTSAFYVATNNPDVATPVGIFGSVNGVGAPGINGFKSRGTLASPTATSTDDSLFSIGGYAWDTTDTSEYKFGAGITFKRSSETGGIRAPGYMVFNTAPTASTISERMRILANGKVGINTTTPKERLDVKGDVLFSESTAASIFTDGIFGVRINSQVGSMSIARNGSNVMAFYHTSNILGFGGDAVGTISITTTTTSFNTSSDYRLKENVTYDFDATTRLKQLKPARFNFIIEPDKTVDGFLAHEVQSIIPEAITGTKDGVEDIGNITDVEDNIIKENVTKPETLEEGQIWTKTGTKPVYQGIDQAKLTPILTKALQEAIARIEQLEARLTALES